MTARILGNLDLAAARSRGSADPVGIDVDATVERADALRAEGADLLGIVIDATADGPVPAWVTPLVGRLAERCPVVVATEVAEVALAAVAAGATILEDRDGTLGPLAAELGVGAIVTRAGEVPAGDPAEVVARVAVGLVGRAGELRRAGAGPVWIDPGAGTAGAAEVTLLAGLDRLVATGWPVALGVASRPAVTGSDGDRSPAAVAATTLAVVGGADLVRVDDVKAAKQAVTVAAGHAHLRRE